jgi:hypothetical protein
MYASCHVPLFSFFLPFFIFVVVGNHPFCKNKTKTKTCRNSDIWRNFPKIRHWILPLVFLTNEQGSRPSVAAAVLEDIKMGVNDHPDCCYIQPYYLPGIPFQNVHTTPHPIFEMLGPYQGYRYTKPRIPPPLVSKDDTRSLSPPGEALWNVCTEVTQCQWPDS